MRADTNDYLVNLRHKVGALIETGGDTIAPGIDPSRFAYLLNCANRARRNAQATFEQMEWE